MKVIMVKEGDMQSFEQKLQFKLDDLSNNGLEIIDIKYKPLYGLTRTQQYGRDEKIYYTAMIIAR